MYFLDQMKKEIQQQQQKTKKQNCGFHKGERIPQTRGRADTHSRRISIMILHFRYHSLSDALCSTCPEKSKKTPTGSFVFL